MSHISKILAPTAAMIRHQTGASCCVVLVRDLEGEYYVVVDGKGWKGMVVAAANRVLETAMPATAEDSSVVQKEAQG